MSAESSNSSDAPPDTLRVLALSASFTVKDLEESLAWYRKVMGFGVKQKHEREGRLVAVSLDGGILLGRDDGARGWDRVKGEGFSIQLTTDQNIDAIAKRITDAGGTLDTPPTDMPWGVRVFRVRDPDGFKLVISSPRP